MRKEFGEYKKEQAIADFYMYLRGESTDHLMELTYQDKKRIHNLKYFTWIEQQGKSHDELMDQWYSTDYWEELQSQVDEINALIMDFNEEAYL